MEEKSRGRSTEQYSIKALFEQKQTFVVPKYQRSYAWDDEAIFDFIDDISKCLSVRESGDPKHHFFGGVVTVRKEVPGTTRDNYEIIDGQQRLSSFVMLVSAIIRKIDAILEELGDDDAQLGDDDLAAKKYLAETRATLKNTFIVFRASKGIEYVDVPKLTLSKADHGFLQSTLAGNPDKAERDSHRRIQYAWSKLCDFVDVYLFEGKPTAAGKAAHIQQLVNKVLGLDCSIVFMCSTSRTEAYQIFQVLNDRGVQLGNGDLLRASTLELLDDPKLGDLQDQVAKHWDNILSYGPRTIDDFLLWYFSSVSGFRPKPSDLADQFLEHRFKCKGKQKLNKKEAEGILKEVKRLEADFATLETLMEGEWPYPTHDNVKYWDRERLSILVTHLNHTNAMPLLLALSTLDVKVFSEAVSMLERFVFRYKTIVNAHISPATNMYLKHAAKVREQDEYALAGLRNDMNDLLDKYAPDSVFLPAIRELRFSPRAGNKHIRYFLLSVEDYGQWFTSGAQDAPKCKDKSRVFDIAGTTIEHVYPQKAATADKDAGLEKRRHDLGNLTIAAPGENDKLGNKPYKKKRAVFQNSGLRINREIGANGDWTAELIGQRGESLSKMALKIFRA
ncbi:MAG: DUF262 domain-containing protein [Paracoccus sp. (in: a-proteobacteria)]